MTITNKLQQLIVILLMMALVFHVQELSKSNVLQKSLPEWPFLLVIYFSVSSRFFFSVTSAFVFGLIQDVFIDIPTIGLHAIIYVLASFIMISIHLRFKHMSIYAQSLFVAMLVSIKIIIVMLYEIIFYSFPVHFWVLLSIPLSMLAWLLLHLLFRFFAEKYVS